MEIDKTLERIANETIVECKDKKIDVNKQDVYRTLNFMIDCFGLAISKAVPIEIPYLGKVIPKVTIAGIKQEYINYHTAKGTAKEVIQDNINKKLISKSKAVSELKNQRAFTNKETDDLLEGYIAKDLTSLSFAFNNETKTEFLEKLNIKSVRDIYKV